MTKGGIIATIFFLILAGGVIYLLNNRTTQTLEPIITPTPVPFEDITPPQPETSILQGTVNSISEETVVYKNSKLLTLTDTQGSQFIVYVPENTPIGSVDGEIIELEEVLNRTVEIVAIPAEGGYEATEIVIRETIPTEPDGD